MKQSAKRARWRARKAARKVSVDTCVSCGSHENIEKHHPDIENWPLWIKPLCGPCHVAEHETIGNWGGRSPRSPRPCVICGTPHSKPKTKTCSGPCLTELGRRNAMKRWAS